MKPVYFIWKREVTAFFSTWLAYVLLFGFVLMSGYFFVAGPIAAQKSDLGDFFGNLAIAVIFLAPLMSMRLLAEEKKSGTLELLLTSPVTTLDIVLGQYLGALFLIGLF
ncbi:MAG: ABC transporter permease subunit, partial [Spirochaetia bacterium]|nr:ABC transporter permease subunit [Spirochaetia bacterium]